jgi:hypothetical protein
MPKPTDTHVPTDTEILDWLEVQNAKKRFTGKCIFRWSTYGCGWRLHECDGSLFRDAHDTVREAVAAAMSEKVDDY